MHRSWPRFAHAAVVALGVAAVSALQAQALSSLLAAALGPRELTLAPAPPEGARTSPDQPAPPASVVSGALRTGAREVAGDGLDRRCPEFAARIVTEAEDPTWSLATLSDRDGPPRLVRVGDRFRDHTVTFIGRSGATPAPSVWLERDQRRCRAELSTAATVTPATPAPVTPAPAVQRSAPAPRSLLSGARLVPAPSGVRLLGVRPGSLLESIGLASGDVITALNGADARRPETALLALARLRQGRRDEELRVSVERGGRPLVLTYRLR